MFNFALLTLLCYISGVLSGMLGPCKKADSECLHKTINEVFPIVLGGIPSKGVESSDPLFDESIEGNFPFFRYKLINSTITGYKNCDVKNSRFDVDALKLYFELHCSNITLVGDYDINGMLLIMPIEGKGPYKVTAEKYLMAVNAKLKKTKGDDGKTYVTMKNYDLKSTIKGPFDLELGNLFNGQKDLSDRVHDFLHEHYKEIAELVQDPFFNAVFEVIAKNINKFLKTEPLEEIIVN